MAEDIAPKLVESVSGEFHKLYDESEKVQTLLRKVKDGTATYQEAHAYATEVHNLTSQAWQKFVTADTLPDGRMYYNIANRLIPSTLDENFNLVSDYAVKAQQQLNEKAKIGLKAQAPEKNQDRIDGLVQEAANAEQYADIEGRLLSGMENFALNVVDETIRANAAFQYSAGLRPRIIRTTHGGACRWCAALAGTYDYPDVPHDVYRRHQNCRCIVTYDPADGSKQVQNVHTKRISTDKTPDVIERRKRIGLRSLDTFRPAEYTGTIRKYAKINRAEVIESAKNGKRHSGVYWDAVSNKTKKQLQQSVVSRTAQVERHADKIAHPEYYVIDWDKKDPAYQRGLLRKWEKDMTRNAEQAEIELAVFEERFGQ